jgi:hypothetical protein
MEARFDFGRIEAVCAAINHIASDKRIAFTGRIKQLLKQELMEERPGRGKKGTYSFADLMRFVIAVELIQSGIMPVMAVRIVNENWEMLVRSVALYLSQSDKESRHYVWAIRPTALNALATGSESDEVVEIDVTTAQALPDFIVERGRKGHGWRTLIIEGSSLTRTVMKVITGKPFQYATRDQLLDDLHDEIDAVEGQTDGQWKQLRKLNKQER